MFNTYQFLMTSKRPRLIILGPCTALFLFGSYTPSIGNPTGKNPSQPLKIHATVAGAEVLANELHQTYLEELDVVNDDEDDDVDDDVVDDDAVFDEVVL